VITMTPDSLLRLLVLETGMGILEGVLSCILTVRKCPFSREAQI
jgi:hypothetical protein